MPPMTIRDQALLGQAGIPDPDPIEPDAVADLICWLKADIGITKDGSDLVSTWADQASGGNNDLTQSTASEKPLWVDNVQNSLPIIRFDGTDDSMQKTTWYSGAISQPYTIFFVMRNLRAPVSITGEEYFYDSGSSSRVVLLVYGPTDTFYLYSEGGGQISSIDVDDTDFHYLTSLYDGTSSLLRYDGGAETFNVNCGTLDMNGLTLAQRKTGANVAKIEIGEIIVYDADVSDSDRLGVETYLKQKWDL
jgi:hypothetical protein